MMREIGFLDITDDKRLILKIGDYQGTPEKIDLRIYIKKGDDLVATKSGVGFSSEWLDSFLELVSKLNNI